MLRPFFTYYGAKWRLAKQYPKPRFNILFEPFAGSACYALRYHKLDVRLSDADPVICGIWDWLIHASTEDIERLPMKVEHVNELGSSVPQGARDLIGFWLNRGAAAPAKQASAWMKNGTWPKQFWGKHVKQRLVAQVPLIRDWKIENTTYEQIPNVKATWFIDPPYQKMGRHYKFNKINYEELGKWCLTRDGQIIVCEQKGADWLNFQPFRSAKARRGKSEEVSFMVGHDDSIKDLFNA